MRRELKTASTGEVVNPDIIRDNIPDGAVNSDKIENGAIVTIKLANGSVVTAKILDGAITTSKLADGSVTSAKLGASSVTNEKVNNGAIDYTKLAQALKNLIDGKQDGLSETQLDAVNSGIDATTLASLIAHLTNTSNPHSVTKSQVGLGNVDNTSDLDKPVSTPQQNALNGKLGASDIYILEITEFTDAIPEATYNALMGAKIPLIRYFDEVYILSDSTSIDNYVYFTTPTLLVDSYYSQKLIRIDKTTREKTLVTRAVLKSGETIKTINNESIVGSGNFSISGGTQLYSHNISMEFDITLNVEGTDHTKSVTYNVILYSTDSVAYTISNLPLSIIRNCISTMAFTESGVINMRMMACILNITSTGILFFISGYDANGVNYGMSKNILKTSISNFSDTITTL